MNIKHNEPCPCGSGKKYKKCCINKPENSPPTSKSKQDVEPLKKLAINISQIASGKMQVKDFIEREAFEEIKSLTKNFQQSVNLHLLEKEDCTILFVGDFFHNIGEVLGGKKGRFHLILTRDGDILLQEHSIAEYSALFCLQLLLTTKIPKKEKKQILWDWDTPYQSDIYWNHKLIYTVLNQKFLQKQQNGRFFKLINKNDEKEITLERIHYVKPQLQIPHALDYKVKAFDDDDTVELDPGSDYSLQPSKLRLTNEFFKFYMREINECYYTLSSCFNELEFIFSDNVKVTGIEIFCHPYAILLPDDFLISDQLGSAELQEFVKGPFEDDMASSPIEKKVFQYYSNYLFQVLKAAQNHRVPFYISDENYFCLPVEFFDTKTGQETYIPVAKPASKEAHLEHRLFLQPQNYDHVNKSKFSVVLPESGFEYDPDMHYLLKLSSAKSIIESITDYSFDNKTPIQASLDKNTNEIEIDFKRVGNPAPYVNKLYQNLRDNGHKIQTTKPIIIKDFQLHSYLLLSSKHQDKIDFKFELTTDFLHCYLHSLPFDELMNLFVLTQDGIKGLIPNWNEFVSDHNRFIRQSDLLMLRHQGIALFLWMHSIKTCIELEQTPKKKDYIKKQYQILEPKIIDLHRRGQNESITSLDQLCSDGVIKSIKYILGLFYDNFINLRDYRFYFKGQEYSVDLSRSAYTALKDLLNVYTEYHQTDFHKSKFNNKTISTSKLASHSNVEPFSPRASEKNTTDDHHINFPNAFEACFSCNHGKLKILIDENPVEELRADDFKTEFKLNSGESNQIEWFDLNPKVFFKGIEISTTKVNEFLSKSLIEYQGQFYSINANTIPALSWLDYFWHRLNGDSHKKRAAKAVETFHTLPRSKVLDMLALRMAGIPVTGDKKWEDICKTFDELQGETTSTIAPGLLSTHLENTLKPYQKQGVKRMLDLFSLGLGGVLADDMGLGKTLQMLAFLDALKHQSALKSCLIVVPTSLVYNWESEGEKFVPEMPMEIFDPKQKATIQKCLEQGNDAIVITTYGLLTRHIDFFQSFRWQIALFDEAQNLKNIKSIRTTAARSLNAEYKYCLTGTPMENSFNDFYSIMDLAVPGCLGEYKEFNNIYNFQSSKNSIDSISKRDIDFLKMKTKPLVLRRKKEDVLLELPKKTESLIKLPFERNQKKIYKDIAISWNEKVLSKIEAKGQAHAQLEMLTALLRLRQACSIPQIIPDVIYTKRAPKLEALTDAIRDVLASQDSAIIFTNFLSSMEVLAADFEKHGIPYYFISGKTSAANRKKILHAFNESPQAGVLMMTLKTGGVGLNLTKANYVFHLEPWWNPAAENQGTDRTYRMGQEKHVHVYRYIMSDSVEEKIETLKDRKNAAFCSLFEDVNDVKEKTFAGKGLSQEDFRYLLS